MYKPKQIHLCLHFVFLPVIRSCGNKSLFSLRVAASENQELVGGADMYKPVCRSCYLAATRAQESQQGHGQQEKKSLQECSRG